MGSRVMIQFTSAEPSGEITPIIYAQGFNLRPTEMLCRLRDQMEVVCGRGDEASLIAARCVQHLTEEDRLATGVRIENARQEMTLQDLVDGAEMFVVEIGARWRVRQIHGYDPGVQYPSHARIDWVYEAVNPDISPMP